MRRANDAYFTPAKAVLELLANLDFKLEGTCLECCAGEGAIANVLKENTSLQVYTNDIDLRDRRKPDYHLDSTLPVIWQQFLGCDWVISNPPFNQAAKIISLAYEKATTGIIMLLRASYLEPCHDRAEWLRQHPPDQLISIPRISFTGNGKTDVVCTFWFVWVKDEELKSKITNPFVIVPRT